MISLPKAYEMAAISARYSMINSVKMSIELAAKRGEYKIYLSLKQGNFLSIALKEAGYRVKTVAKGHNENQFEVSWNE